MFIATSLLFFVLHRGATGCKRERVGINGFFSFVPGGIGVNGGSRYKWSKGYLGGAQPPPNRGEGSADYQVLCNAELLTCASRWPGPKGPHRAMYGPRGFLKFHSDFPHHCGDI